MPHGSFEPLLYRNSEGLVWASCCGLGCSLAAWATVPKAPAGGLIPLKGAETWHMAVSNCYRNCEGLAWALATVPNAAAEGLTPFPVDQMLGLFADICGKPCFLTFAVTIMLP